MTVPRTRGARIIERLDELPKPGFSRMHVGVIGVLLVLGLLAAGWLLLRARPVALASPGEVVTMGTPLQAAPTASPSISGDRDPACSPCTWGSPRSRAGPAAGELARPGCDRRSRWTDRSSRSGRAEPRSAGCRRSAIDDRYHR